MPGPSLFTDFMAGRGVYTDAELSELRQHERTDPKAMLSIIGTTSAAVLSREKDFKVAPLSSPKLQRRGLHLWRVIASRYAAERRGASQAFLDDGLVIVPGLIGETKQAIVSLRSLPVSHKKTYANLATWLKAKPLEKVMGKSWPYVRDAAGLGRLPDAPLKHNANCFGQRIVSGPETKDEQATPHSDCFMPAVKWWWFPEPVTDGCLRYARGSAALTPDMLEFHYRESIRIARGDVDKWRLGNGRGHIGGSLRFGDDELEGMGLACTPVEVDADTLVIANVFGVHARGIPGQKTERLALHSSIRPARPFA